MTTFDFSALVRFFRVWGSMLAAIMVMAGCSEMQFVGQLDTATEEDPREDIILTEVAAQLTSGGIVQQKIGGGHAVFSQNQNELTIKDIRVSTVASTGEIQSVTKADVGQVFFEDKPAQGLGRRDMKFAGDVLYRNPKKEDPTSDSLQMRSELIMWDESAKKFLSPMGYEMVLLPKGQKPVRQSGKSFEATQDLSRFVVKAGAVTTELDKEPGKERQEMLAQFEAWKSEVEESASAVPTFSTTVSLPSQ